MSNKDEIDKIFRKRFENEQSPVSDRVWENIKQTLPPENNGPGRSNWINPLVISGIVVVLSAIGTLFLLNSTKETKQNVSNEQVVNSGSSSSGIKEVSFNGRNEANNKVENNLGATDDVHERRDIPNSINDIKSRDNKKSAKLKTEANNLKNTRESSNKTAYQKKENSGKLKERTTGKKEREKATQNENGNLLAYHNGKTKRDNTYKEGEKTGKEKLATKSDVDLNTSANQSGLNKNTDTKLEGISVMTTEGENTKISNNNRENENPGSSSLKEEQDGNNSEDNRIVSNVGVDEVVNSKSLESPTIEPKDEEKGRINNNLTNQPLANEENANTENLSVEEKKSVGNSIENNNIANKEIPSKNVDDKNAEIKRTGNKDGENNPFTTVNDSENNLSNVVTERDTISDNSSAVIANESILKEEAKDSLLTKEISEDSLAQESKEEKDKKEKQHAMVPFSIDVFLSPARNYRSVSGDNTAIADKNQNERVKRTLGAGVRLNYSFNEKLYVSMGLQYSHFGEKYNYHKETSVAQTKYIGHWVEDSTNGTVNQIYVIDDTVVTVTKSQRSEKKNNYYKYFSIPLSVTYSFGKGKIRYSLSAGISANFLINAYSYRVSSDSSQAAIIESTSGDKNPFRRMTMSILICPAITYSFNERWKLLVEPGVNIFMNSVYGKEYAISHKPYSFTIKAGLRYVLK